MLGIIFISLSAFHSNIWFDESYSVVLARHSFIDIWNYTALDVHPPLYYWLLHIVYLIFGSNILCFRLFSLIGIAIIGILGYTHIRKEFGEKCGMLFSAFSYFIPIMTSYAVEIRMYSWSCLVVTLMLIYAYRFYINIKENKKTVKNLVLFGIFSICSCYIHYYALITAGLVNLVLLIYLIKKRKQNEKELKAFLILVLVQILLYLPWIIYFINQVRAISGKFWINMSPIGTTIEVISTRFW